MARYDKTKKYWLQLKEDWFEEDAIRWLEDQKNGKEYSLFYMKLMLKSIKTNGILIRQVGKMLIPYEPQSIADLTRTELDTVIVAMELLKKIGLVEILEDGAIYIEQVRKMIGFATEGAIRKQLQREKTQENQLGWTTGGQMSTKDKDKDKDKDIIKDKDKDIVEQVDETVSDTINEIVSFLNEKAKTSYRSSTPKTRQLIGARLKEKFVLEDFKKVIEFKCQQWLNDVKMSAYIRPETLFGTKFEGYLNEAKRGVGSQVLGSQATHSDEYLEKFRRKRG